MGTCWASISWHGHSPASPAKACAVDWMFSLVPKHWATCSTLSCQHRGLGEKSGSRDMQRDLLTFSITDSVAMIAFVSQPLPPMVSKHFQSSLLPWHVLLIRLPAPSFQAGMAGALVNHRFQAATRNIANEVMPKTFTLIKVWDCFNISRVIMFPAF